MRSGAAIYFYFSPPQRLLSEPKTILSLFAVYCFFLFKGYFLKKQNNIFKRWGPPPVCFCYFTLVFLINGLSTNYTSWNEEMLPWNWNSKLSNILIYMVNAIIFFLIEGRQLNFFFPFDWIFKKIIMLSSQGHCDQNLDRCTSVPCT